MPVVVTVAAEHHRARRHDIAEGAGGVEDALRLAHLGRAGPRPVHLERAGADVDDRRRVTQHRAAVRQLRLLQVDELRHAEIRQHVVRRSRRRTGEHEHAGQHHDRPPRTSDSHPRPSLASLFLLPTDHKRPGPSTGHAYRLSRSDLMAASVGRAPTDALLLPPGSGARRPLGAAPRASTEQNGPAGAAARRASGDRPGPTAPRKGIGDMGIAALVFAERRVCSPLGSCGASRGSADGEKGSHRKEREFAHAFAL